MYISRSSGAAAA